MSFPTVRMRRMRRCEAWRRLGRETRRSRDDLVLPFRTGYVRLRSEESARIVKTARRRFRRHNGGRKFVENELWSALAASFHDSEIGPLSVKDTLRGTPEIREALDRLA